MKWFWQKKHLTNLACIISPTTLDCFAISNKKVIAFQSYPLMHHEVTSRIINSNYMSAYIEKFINDHALNPHYFTCALDSQLVTEYVIEHYQEDYPILCRKQINAQHWYSAHLTYEQRFTYQLFAHALKIPCLLITSTTYCLLSMHAIKTELSNIEQLSITLESYLQKSHSESKTNQSIPEYTKQLVAQSLTLLSQREYETK